MSATWMNIVAISAATGGLLGSLIFKVVAHLVSEEVESRLDQIGYAVLRLACRRLPKKVRESYYEEWAAELDAHFHGAKDRPITRLYWSLRFPCPLLLSARSFARIHDSDAFPRRPGVWETFAADRTSRVVLAGGIGPLTMWMAFDAFTAPELPWLIRIFFGALGLALVPSGLLILLSEWVNATRERGAAAPRWRSRSADLVMSGLSRALPDKWLAPELRQGEADS